jgi:SAM-dependent methyltransferase
MPLLQSDATALPARAGTFGSVLAVHVLHLVPDWRIAVDEAVRVLRRGGALVASFPTDNRAAGSGRRDGAANDPARMGLRQEAGAPWAAVVRESARRHGMTRRQVGAHDPAAVAAYLGPRGTARELEPVPVRSVTTLGESITNIERQHFSWTWDHPAERAGAVAADVRAWAEREAVPLDTAHEADTASRWWVFELLP